MSTATPHAAVAASYPDWLIEAALADLTRRNLRDQANHETRWCAERSKALRAERRARKDKGNYHP